MKKNKKGKLNEHVIAFIASVILFSYTLINYNVIVFEKGQSTGSQAFRRLLRNVHQSLGKEYVILILLSFCLFTGGMALRGYLKEKKNNENQS